MVQKLVRNPKYYLLLRGRTYYFRYTIPTEVRSLCPNLPIEVKRSLRTDSYTEALTLIAQKLKLIKVLQKMINPQVILKLLSQTLDFSKALSWQFPRLLILTSGLFTLANACQSLQLYRAPRSE